MEGNCAICGKKFGVFNLQIEIRDKRRVCTKCWRRAGLRMLDDISRAKEIEAQEIYERIEEAVAHEDAVRVFEATLDLGEAAKFNDNTRQMILAGHKKVYDSIDPQRKLPGCYGLFRYDQIVGFELLENGESISTSLPFDNIGTSTDCRELNIKVTVKDYKEPAFYVPMLSYTVNTTSRTFKKKMKTAQDILSKLQLIMNEKSQHRYEPTDTPMDKFEEIRKYMLVDEGIISAEEYEHKRRELLGLGDEELYQEEAPRIEGHRRRRRC